MPTWPAKNRVNTLSEENPRSSPIPAMGAYVETSASSAFSISSVLR